MMKDRSRGASSHEFYIFDAADERIATIATTGLATEGTWTWTLRDESGKVLREYQTPLGATKALWLASYVYRDGSLLGAERVAEEGGRRHFHLDHLGTPRLVTGAGGVQLAAHDFYPFGRERTDIHQDSLAGMREESMKFTGHERDFNGGTFSDNTDYLDYMHARYYNPNGARFLSVDSHAAKPHRPSSWYKYAYADGNPVKFVDRTGKYIELATEADRKFFVSALAHGTGNKAARQLLLSMASDPNHTLTLRTGNLTPPNGGVHTFQYGDSSDVHAPYRQVPGDVSPAGVTSTVDARKMALSSYPTPTITTYHEMQHASIMFTQGMGANALMPDNISIDQQGNVTVNSPFEQFGRNAEYLADDVMHAMTEAEVSKLVRSPSDPIIMHWTRDIADGSILSCIDGVCH